MSNQDTEQQEDTRQPNTDQKEDSDQQITTDDDGVNRYESGQIADKPEPSDEQKKQAEEMSKSYVEKRPTTVLPGSDNTVTGKAVNDWIDDEGNPVHGDISEERQEAAERDRETNERAIKAAEEADREDGADDDSDESEASDGEAKKD